jgi:hypothetical protein
MEVLADESAIQEFTQAALEKKQAIVKVAYM